MDKGTISDMKRVVFPGQIHVVTSQEETERCVDYLLTQNVLGFDTETRPSFTKKQQFKCSLLQVATHHNCFLFRLHLTGMTPAIIRLLTDKTVTKVGLAWKNDTLSLHELQAFEPGSFIELQDMVNQIGIEDKSLVKIYANLFQERISKAERLSNWERDVLKDSQKMYAAIDAWACVRIYRELLRLEETGDYELVIVPEEEKLQYDETSISETW